MGWGGWRHVPAYVSRGGPGRVGRLVLPRGVEPLRWPRRRGFPFLPDFAHGCVRILGPLEWRHCRRASFSGPRGSEPSVISVRIVLKAAFHEGLIMLAWVAGGLRASRPRPRPNPIRPGVDMPTPRLTPTRRLPFSVGDASFSRGRFACKPMHAAVFLSSMCATVGVSLLKASAFRALLRFGMRPSALVRSESDPPIAC